MRKLVSIRKIEDVQPIEKASLIEKVRIGGWWSVVTKDYHFKPGDLCCFFEIDSLLPIREPYLFLEGNCAKESTLIEGVTYEGYRLRTKTLRGVTSQGLALPLSHFPGIPEEEGKDVTGFLGVVKYERILTRGMDADIVGDFPGYLSKTDEERIQNLLEYLDKYRREKFYGSEKIDGCLKYSDKIETSSGPLPIGAIVNKRKNVKVLSYNEIDGSLEYKKILNYHKIPTKGKKILSIAIGHKGKGNREKVITCTDNHKFFSDNRWIEAKELSVGQKLSHKQDVLSEELKQIILGCLLGDSSLNGNRSDGYKTILFNHSIKQKEYFEYKKRLFGALFLEKQDAVSGYGSIIKRGILKSNSEIKNFIDKFIEINGRKTINQSWIDQLTPIALSFWYMDDGTLKNRDEEKQLPTVSLCTQGFSLKENELLQKGLFDKYGVTCTIGEKETYKGHQLNLNLEGSKKFLSLIAPYVCESMKYKLPLKYESFVCYWKNKTFQTTPGIIETPILSIKRDEKTPNTQSSYFYDLTIEGNHNYFVKNILVHNCSSTFCKYDNIFDVYQKAVRLKAFSENPYWDIARKYNLPEKLPNNFAVQAEAVGPGIDNALELPELDGYVFSVFDVLKAQYLGLDDMILFAKNLGMKTVPILFYEFILDHTCEDLLKLADRKSALNPKKNAEGIVFRLKSTVEKVSFKVISNKYLGKEK